MRPALREAEAEGVSVEADRRARHVMARAPARLSVERMSLGGVMVLSAILNFIGLGSEGYANTYYAAAVKSMLGGWHNFFFVSFDPGGFVSVDKPPLGLWLQVASARVFGFSGVSMLLPQGIAAVLSVIVLYMLVARNFGHGAGLISSLALAFTPVAVVDNRNNTSDSVLILLLLLSAWAVTRAAETGRLRWLLVGATLIGLGFNVKEMEAFLVLPPTFLLYLVGTQRGWLGRIAHLMVAGLVTLVVSFAWIVAVDLTPAGQRPYVSDSGTNSELSLALGYNGFGRLATGLLSRLPSIPFLQVKIDGTIVPGISMDIGNPGLLRLFRPAIGSQVSWLLLLALAGLAVALIRPSSRFAVRSERSALLFWGSWLLAAGWFFSVARFYHLYYLIMLAPPVAALAGIGLSRLWDEYRASIAAPSPRIWQGWLLPITVAAAGVAQEHILSGYVSWNAWLGPLVLISCLLVAVVLSAGRLGMRLAVTPDLTVGFEGSAGLVATVLAALALFVAPTALAADSIANGNGGSWLPQAGPSTGTGFGFGGPGGPGGAGQGGPPGGTFGARPPSSRVGTGSRGNSGAAAGTGRATGAPSAGNGAGGAGPAGGFGGGGPGGGGGAITFAGGNTPTLNAGLISYLSRHRGHARYLVATSTSTYASLFILQTDQPVMALGGYQGWDYILTLVQLKHLVSTGTIRFFLLPSSGGSANFSRRALPGGVDAGLSSVNDGLTNWVTSACRTVPTSAYQTNSRTGTTSAGNGPGGGPGTQGPGQLYDCASAA